MLKSMLMLAILAAPQLHADVLPIVFYKTGGNFRVGDPPPLFLGGTLVIDDTCSVCTISQPYGQQHVVIQNGILGVRFTNNGGTFIGLGSLDPDGFDNFRNAGSFIYYRDTHILSGGGFNWGGDSMSFRMDGTYTLANFGGVLDEFGVYSIGGFAPTPEPSAIVLLMSALVIAIPALRRRYT